MRKLQGEQLGSREPRTHEKPGAERGDRVSPNLGAHSILIAFPQVSLGLGVLANLIIYLAFFAFLLHPPERVRARMWLREAWQQ